MLGFKTQESQKFNRFWQLVQDTAGRSGCVFFGFAGEGRDFETTEMEGEDFSGWLVPLDNATAFEKFWKKSSINNEKLESKFPHVKFLFAIWKINNGAISIEFREF